MSHRLRQLADQVAGATGDESQPFVALENVGVGNGALLPEAVLAMHVPEPTGMVAFRMHDVLFGKLRPYLAKSWRADRNGLCSAELIVMRPRPTTDSRWLSYVAQSSRFVQYAVATSEGVKMPRTSWEKLRLYDIEGPVLERQQMIADYLDTETTRIEETASYYRRMIDLLLERRSAFISRSVAVGPSTRVRRVITICTSGPRGWGEIVTDTGSMFIRSANLARDSVRIADDGMAFVPPQSSPEAIRSRVREGDVLVAITGANTGWVGLPEATHAGAFVSQHVAILRPEGVAPAWLAYSIASERGQRDLLGSQYGGTKKQLGLEDLRDLEIRVPQLATQWASLSAIARVEAATRDSISALTRQVDLLLERRRALITSAVTGKLTIPRDRA